MRRFDLERDGPAAVVAALRRPPLGEMPAPEGARPTLERLFGPEVTPQEAVRAILAEVRREGDAAVIRFTRELDRVDLAPEALWVGPEAFEAVAAAPWAAPLEAHLRAAAGAIEAFHRRQVPAPLMDFTGPGVAAGWVARPVRRAAIYVPGGTAPLVSTLLMGVIPARLAGVSDIVVATPPPVHPAILLAARIAGAGAVLQVGGAQAVGALAYGTQHIRPVDVIAGPGNLFVQLAKREVVGVVGIDGLAGPTELVILADAAAPAQWVAADLLAQAEHAPDAAAVLITDVPVLIDAVSEHLERQLAGDGQGGLPRAAIARAALDRWGALVSCRRLDDDGMALANALAPEHLELMAAEPMALLGHVQHAGAVFVGVHSPEALGDYAAGANHILPTNGTARFASAVGVHTFLRWTSVVMASPSGAARLAPVVQALAEAEGLVAHARSVAVRMTAQRPRGAEGDPA